MVGGGLFSFIKYENRAISIATTALMTGGAAYLALAYLIASAVYLLATAALGLGTPFKDSLSDAQRRVTKSRI